MAYRGVRTARYSADMRDQYNAGMNAAINITIILVSGSARRALRAAWALNLYVPVRCQCQRLSRC